MDKLTAIKIKYEDGTYSDQIPVSVLGENVEWDATHTLVDILGSIDVDITGTIQDQITQLFNSKVNATDLSNYVNSTMKTEVASWLNNYISPATGTIAYDASLSIQGAAADAKAAGQIVQISTTKPTKENNRIWVGASEEEYEVPTMEDIAPAYDSTKTYAIGNIVSYDGQLYECTAEITTPEAWTAAHWTAATVGTELNDIKSDVTSITGNSVLEFSSDHHYINLSGLSVTMVEGVPQYSSGSTSYYCARIPCSAGDKFTINGTGGNDPRLWGFVSSVGEVLLVANASVSETNLVITAPENASWLIAHRNDNSQSYSGVLTRNLIDSFAEKSDVLLKQRSLNLYDESAKTIGLLNSSGVVSTSYTDYDTTDFIPVTPSHTLCFQNDNFINPVIYYCFYDINKSLSGSRGSFKLVGYYGTISVPNNASYVRISYKKEYLRNVMITDGSNPVPYLPYLYSLDVQKCNIGKCYVDLQNESIKVVSKYGTNTDFVVSFGKRGPNNLPDFRSFASASDTEEFVSDVIPTASVIMTTGTDWQGPYIVKAVDNIDGDLPNSNDFTGGNHNYNNTGSGDYSATARCSSLRYFVNGKEVSTFYGYADNVEVRWINYVQATNTKKADGTGREVIKEEHRAIFDGIKWTITVDIEMLEDVQIATYYGFQMSGVNSIYPNFRFVNGVNKAWYTNSKAHSSGNKNPDAIIAMGASHMIQITLGHYGLGNRDYYDGTTGAFCTENGNKCYFNLINDSSFSQGEVVSAKASYQFSPV